MKNLKKVLALVLVVALAISIGAGAVTLKNDVKTVADNSAAAEAVNVLIGMGIVEGNAKGDLKLESTITRAEMAKILTCAILGSDVAANLPTPEAQLYSDVPLTEWYAPYIDFLSNCKALVGYGNGKFGPNDPVTGIQVTKMIVAILGYNANGELLGHRWTSNTYAEGSTLGIINSDNIAVGVNEPCARQYAFLALYDAFRLNFVEYSSVTGKYIPAVDDSQVVETGINTDIPTAWKDAQYLAYATAQIHEVKATKTGAFDSEVWTSPIDKKYYGVNADDVTDKISAEIVGKYASAEKFEDVGAKIGFFYNTKTGEIYFAKTLTERVELTAASPKYKTDAIVYYNFVYGGYSDSIGEYSEKEGWSLIKADHQKLYAQVEGNTIVALQYETYELYMSKEPNASIPEYSYGMDISTLCNADAEVWYNVKALPETGLSVLDAKGVDYVNDVEFVTIAGTKWNLAQEHAAYDRTELGLFSIDDVKVADDAKYSFYYNPFTKELLGIVPEYAEYGKLAFVAESWLEMTKTDVPDGHDTFTFVLKANLLFVDGTSGSYTIAKIDGLNCADVANGLTAEKLNKLGLHDILKALAKDGANVKLLKNYITDITHYGTTYVDVTEYVNDNRFVLAATGDTSALLFTLANGKFTSVIRDWEYEDGSFATTYIIPELDEPCFTKDTLDARAIEGGKDYTIYVRNTSTFAYYDDLDDNSASKFEVTYKTGKHYSWMGDEASEKIYLFSRNSGTNGEAELVFAAIEQGFDAPEMKTGSVYYVTKKLASTFVNDDVGYETFNVIDVATGEKIEGIAVRANWDIEVGGYYALLKDEDGKVENIFIPANEDDFELTAEMFAWNNGKHKLEGRLVRFSSYYEYDEYDYMYIYCVVGGKTSIQPLKVSKNVVIVNNGDYSVKTMAEFIDLAKKNSENLTIKYVTTDELVTFIEVQVKD